MAEPLVMADCLNKKSEESSSSSSSRKCGGDEDMWRIFGEKPITLTDLLESSPEAQKLKKHNFHLQSDNKISWTGSFSIGNHFNRKRSLLPSNFSIPFSNNNHINNNNNNFPSSSSSSSSSSSLNSNINLVNTTSKLSSSSSSSLLLTNNNNNDSLSCPHHHHHHHSSLSLEKLMGKRKLKLNEDNVDDLHHHHHPNRQVHSSSKLNPDEDKTSDNSNSLVAGESKCLYKMRNIISNINNNNNNNHSLPSSRSKYFKLSTGRILDNHPIIDSSIYHHHHHHHYINNNNNNRPAGQPPCPKKQKKKMVEEDMVAEVSSTVAHL